MIVEYLRYTIEESAQGNFIGAYKNASQPLLKSPCCLTYSLSQCVEDSSQFIIRITWTSASDHLGIFRKSEEFKAFLSHIKPYISAIDEMRHYTELDTAESVDSDK